MTPPVQVVTEFVTVGGVSVAYQIAGQGHPLVCVHGNFASKRWFTELLRDPPAGWQVIAPDQPNFGDSDALPGPITLGAYTTYLHGFVEALGLERVALLGHSLGGGVVQLFAAAYPKLTRGLVLVGSPTPEGLVTAEEHYPFLEGLRGDREAMAQALAPTMSGRLPDYFGGIVDDALKMHPDGFSGNARALENLTLDGRALDPGTVTCPVLVVRGETDYLISPRMAARTAAAYPNGRLAAMSGLGHSPQIEDPERFRVLLTEFLEGLP